MRYDDKDKCWRCGYRLRQTDYDYETNCPGCRTATRVCRNCRFFSNSDPNQCSQTAAKLVANKQSANRCEFFEV